MSLYIKDLKKSYQEPDGKPLPILDIGEFQVNKGEQVALLGSSGCGKSTLLNIIAGISKADSGSIKVDDIELTTLSEVVRDRFRADRIGFVFQTFNLLPAFSALENVLLGMSFSGKKVDKKRAKTLLDQVGLGHRLHHHPQKLSVGEQQRVAVARAIANSPSLLLADEPTANVDFSNQDLILKTIRETCTENNVSLLMVTHSNDVADQFERVEKLSDFNKVGAAV
jgi:putative ABC transport system ATP-binding protein